MLFVVGCFSEKRGGGQLPSTRKKVLVVDDSPTIISLIKVHLVKFDLIILEATDGRQGLDLAISEKPDLIITDYMMPELNGAEFIEALRRESGYADLPVIVLTSSKDHEAWCLTKQAGISYFLRKPIPSKSLQRMVKILLGLNFI